MIESLISILILLYSAILHEIAHAWCASNLGDDTARNLGRLTLHPRPHLDPIGSILLPLLFLFSQSSFFFAWAKPVPINVNRLQNPRLDIIWIAVAGPLTNLTVALFAGLIFKGLGHFPFSIVYILPLVAAVIQINIILALFNLLPIPPLDGSKILSGILPQPLSRYYNQIAPYGIWIILSILLMSSFLHIPVLWYVIAPFYRFLFGLFTGTL